MSKIALAPNASGTGTLSIASPSTNSDYTLTLPAETGTVLTSGGAIDVNASAPADSLAISSAGYVGIGTTSPNSSGASKGLTVNGASTAIYELAVNGTRASYFWSDGTGTRLYDTNTGGSLQFATVNTERMRIDSSGNLLVGITSNPSGYREVLAYDGSVLSGLDFRDSYGSAATNFAVAFRRNGTAVGNITTTLSSTAYNTSSDYRLKDNIAPMTGALATVAQLNPVTYTWKADGSASQGFIAHELQAVVPECVTGEKDAVETVEIKDEDGNVTGTEERPVYQGIDTSFLVATLTAAIKEQQAIIESLTARIEALEAANVPT